jgi:hypothetical protein
LHEKGKKSTKRKKWKTCEGKLEGQWSGK